MSTNIVHFDECLKLQQDAMEALKTCSVPDDVRIAIELLGGLIEQYQRENEAIRGLIERAEIITIESATRTPFKPRMVLADDLEAVLAGRLR